METFNTLMPLLPPKFFYVCIDLPGHGRSSPAQKGYMLDLNWYALSVKRVIDHFNWQKMYMLGHSLGGLISFILAASYPELMIKIILIDSLAIYPDYSIRLAPFMRKQFDLLLKLEKRLSSDEVPTYSLDEFIAKMKEVRKTEVTGGEIRKLAERNLEKISEDKYKYTNDQRVKLLDLKRLITLEQSMNFSQDIKCPILLLLGRSSKVTLPNGKLTCCPLPSEAEIHIIDGDHDLHIARPFQVAHLIGRFLSQELTKSKL